MFENSPISLDELLGTNVETAHFGMSTLAGNAKVRTYVKKAITAFKAGVSAEAIAEILTAGRAEVGQVYSEVIDSEVRECIAVVLEAAFAQTLDSFEARILTNRVIALMG